MNMRVRVSIAPRLGDSLPHSKGLRRLPIARFPPKLLEIRRLPSWKGGLAPAWIAGEGRQAVGRGVRGTGRSDRILEGDGRRNANRSRRRHLCLPLAPVRRQTSDQHQKRLEPLFAIHAIRPSRGIPIPFGRPSRPPGKDFVPRPRWLEPGWIPFPALALQALCDRTSQYCPTRSIKGRSGRRSGSRRLRRQSRCCLYRLSRSEGFAGSCVFFACFPTGGAISSRTSRFAAFRSDTSARDEKTPRTSSLTVRPES